MADKIADAHLFGVHCTPIVRPRMEHFCRCRTQPSEQADTINRNQTEVTKFCDRNNDCFAPRQYNYVGLMTDDLVVPRTRDRVSSP